jgi:Sec-independent protein translocase protein TatA
MSYNLFQWHFRLEYAYLRSHERLLNDDNGRISKKMEIFGIGPLELLLIVFLALVILGPKEMIEMSKKTAGWLRKVRQSDAWKTTREVMDIPNKVMKETGLEDEIRELNTVSKRALSPTAWQADSLAGLRDTQKPDQQTIGGEPQAVEQPKPKNKKGSDHAS